MSGERPVGVDTIVAAASAAGDGERGIVRISGPEAHRLAWAALGLDGESTAPLAPGRVTHAAVDLGGGAQMPAEVLAWSGPRSATGEDVAELHVPGWPPVLTEVVRRAVRAGARPAARGEFTRRALANGRLDLVSALAVGRLAEARNGAEVSLAAAALSGVTAGRGASLREALLDVLALIEAHVDFEDEDTEGVTLTALGHALDAARQLAAALAHVTEQAPGRDGETDVALVGAPNAGKSSLLAALCPDAVTTISPLPGTTRDALDAHAIVDGRRLRLIDGPGIGDAGQLSDELDRDAGRAWLGMIPAGAIVVHVIDGSDTTPPCAELAHWLATDDRPRITLHNKCDLLHDERAPGEAQAAAGTGASGHGTESERGPQGTLLVSAVSGVGLDALRARLVAVIPEPPPLDALVGGEAEAAAAVLGPLTEACTDDWEGRLPLLSLTLRDALQRMEREAEQPLDLDDEVLTRIFSRFCIGK